MATNNFLQWNPTAANQESDSAYLADSQRAGGASDPSIFDAALANKLFYQLSTGMTALMQMMAYKGFPVSDASLGTLAAQLANILTTADLRGYAGLQTVPYASSVVLNAGQYLSWQVALSGDMTITVAGALPGDTLTVILVNDGAGNHIVTWSAPFIGSNSPNSNPNASSLLMFKVKLNGSICPLGPVMSGVTVLNTSIQKCGIDDSPIGLMQPSGGAFTDVIAATCAVGTTLTAPTVATTDNSTNAATTAWAKYGLSMSLVTNGYVGLPTWLGGWMVQWGSTGTLPDSSQQPVSFNGSGFPTQCFGVVATMNNNIGTSVRTMQAIVTSRTGFNVQANGSSSTAFWFAVGN